jgi:hypothetical protein
MLLRANLSKGGDAELRGYGDHLAMPAGPPAMQTEVPVLVGGFFLSVPPIGR